MTDAHTRLTSALADRYAIEGEIGSGGMATVYLAQDLKHDRRVAVKVLKPELASVLGPERFLREIKIAAKLTHPHILPLHDSGEADGFLYYVMPFIEGESLRQRLDREGSLPVADAVTILRDVSDALTEAHAQGVVHRDIKPGNVMLRGQHALVTDFGVARAVSQVTGQHTLTTAGTTVGTPAYMAPEQIEADQLPDHRSDVYSVGVLGYEMLSGHLPFQGSSFASLLAAKLDGRFEPLETAREGLPGPLVGAIHRCLSRDPEDRWESSREFLEELEALNTPAAGLTREVSLPLGARGRIKGLVLPGAVLLAVAAILFLGFKVFQSSRQARVAREVGVPEVRRLRDAGELEAAFAQALEARGALGENLALDTLLASFTDTGTIRTVPEGAGVWWRPYGGREEEWVYLGTTPAVTLVPQTYSDYRFELQGHETRIIPSNNWRFFDQFTEFWGGPVHLPREGSVPPRMEFIPGGEQDLQIPGLESEPPVLLGSYYLSRFEVTNREFKEFVASGGYSDPEWWIEPFVDGNDTLSWEDGMARFLDRTGQPGPESWEAGDYPRGMDDYPVGGVSWYEAMAYAAFRGQELPTLFHWSRALGALSAEVIAPLSVFGAQGPRPVGESGARSPHGSFDMGGNAREWSLSESEGLRFTMGGGWNDPQFMFNHTYPQSPWDRSSTNGIRLADYSIGDPNLQEAARDIELPFRDFLSMEPVSDETFQAFRSFYAYDHTDLDARVEAVDTLRDWIRERVTLEAGYEGERMVLYLHLPRNASPPFQPIIYYPGSGVIHTDSMNDDFGWAWDFLVKTGRAVIYPVYWGTIERRTDLRTDQPDSTAAYRERVVRWSMDFRRSLDWAETRPDLDMDHLGYYGFSWGARLGPLMLALEPRVKAAVLNVGGLKFQPTRPEADPFHFAPRVTIPVLMMNGQLDPIFPLETSSAPLYEILGTPDSLKFHSIEPGGHIPRPESYISQTLDWFTLYLGPIR